MYVEPKYMNKKSIAVFVLVCVLLFYVKRSFLSPTEQVTSPSQTTSQNPTQPTNPTTPVPTQPEQVEKKGWIFNRQTINPKNNTRMDWSIPTTELTQPTKWFNVENVSYWGYRVKSDCLIEYKFKDSGKENVVAKMEWKTSNHYTKGTTDLWSSQKLLEVVDSATEVRFLPLPDQSLVGPTIYRSE